LAFPLQLASCEQPLGKHCSQASLAALTFAFPLQLASCEQLMLAASKRRVLAYLSVGQPASCEYCY
jgi:hypothetical protein